MTVNHPLFRHASAHHGFNHQLSFTLHFRIFGYLDIASILAARQCCKYWKALADSDYVWKKQYGNYFGLSRLGFSPNTSWKDYFLTKIRCFSKSQRTIGLKISPNGRRIQSTLAVKNWGTSNISYPCLIDRVYYCEFLITKYPESQENSAWQLIIGIVSNQFCYKTGHYIGCDPYSFGYIAQTGQVLGGPHRQPTDYGLRYGEGDRIGVLVDMKSQKIVFFRNGLDMGVAFCKFASQNPSDMVYYFAVSTAQFNVQVEICPNAKCREITTADITMDDKLLIMDDKIGDDQSHADHASTNLAWSHVDAPALIYSQPCPNHTMISAPLKSLIESKYCLNFKDQLKLHQSSSLEDCSNDVKYAILQSMDTSSWQIMRQVNRNWRRLAESDYLWRKRVEAILPLATKPMMMANKHLDHIGGGDQSPYLEQPSLKSLDSCTTATTVTITSTSTSPSLLGALQGCPTWRDLFYRFARRFSPIHCTSGLDISMDGFSLTSTERVTYWAAARVDYPCMISGIHYLEFRIDHYRHGSIGNSWKIVCGVVSDDFDYTLTKWVGIDEQSFGYISQNGHKVGPTYSGQGLQYSESYQEDDLIGILVDFEQDSITFYKNRVNLGVAFENFSRYEKLISRPEARFHFAVSLARRGMQVTIIPNAKCPDREIDII